jgi:hypothetical protein
MEAMAGTPRGGLRPACPGATITTRFAGRAQPSVESDLIYLVESEGEWRIARPSATLYRAVGRPEVPPQALAAPG